MTHLYLRVQSFEHSFADECVDHLCSLARACGANNVRHLGLPKKIRRFTVLRSPHIFKKAREQFQLTTATRLVVVSHNTAGLERLTQVIAHTEFPGVHLAWKIRSSATGGSRTRTGTRP